MSMTENPTTTRNKLLLGAATIGVLILCFLGWHYLVHPGEVRTNDAQIDGHVHPINTRIGGTITWVNPDVEDTRFVKAGTVIAHLDPNDYRPTVDRLEGDVQASEAQQRASALNVPITSAAAMGRLSSAQAAVADAESDLKAAVSQKAAADASVAQASASYRRAEADRVRYAALVSTHEISRSEYDQRATDATTTEAALTAAQANSASAEEKIESARQRIKERQSDLRSAQTAPESIASARANVLRAEGETKKSQAALLNARLDLGYTNLIAPVSGIVGRKSMEAGQRVAAGQLMLTIVPPNDVWVIANFRETQLHHMRVGQAAKIHVDSFDRDFEGEVESIGGATGSKYSALAPDNATGNYVKVVQRISVRLRIINPGVGNPLLLPGMSIEVSVRVND